MLWPSFFTFLKWCEYSDMNNALGSWSYIIWKWLHFILCPNPIVFWVIFIIIFPESRRSLTLTPGTALATNVQGGKEYIFTMLKFGHIFNDNHCISSHVIQNIHQLMFTVTFTPIWPLLHRPNHKLDQKENFLKV